jgi:predicted nuclease with RNAse H fold
MLLVGLDAASQPENFGYAVGSLDRGRIDVRKSGLLSTKELPDALRVVVAPALRRAPRALVAVDAPLGWPAALARSLVGHRAGEAIGVEKSVLFCRETDRTVADRVGKKPLEVGADKIARAAHTAVAELGRLRGLVGRRIPLAWSPKFKGRAVIEVYPGATLKARGLADSGYKGSDDAATAVRLQIAGSLRDEMPALANLVDQRADIFDACLCLIAAKDFLETETLQPVDADLVRQEGWIWVRNPQR